MKTVEMKNDHMNFSDCFSHEKGRSRTGLKGVKRSPIQKMRGVYDMKTILKEK
jgi:hypothetical protein